jgi:hypothetical protein
MSETVLKILLKELRLVRLLCQRQKDGGPCGGVVEVPLQRLTSVKKCPVCAADMMPDLDKHDRLKDLAEAIGRLNDVDQTVTVEFVVRELPVPQSGAR